MKKKQAWIGLLISAAFLYLAFRKSDWRQIAAAAGQADYLVVLASLGLYFLSFWLRAVRWRYFLLPAGRPGLNSLFGAIMIGFMSLNVLPFRLGEFIRAYVLGRREGMPAEGVFATIIIERIFDGFTLLLLLITSLLFNPLAFEPQVESWIRAFCYLALAIYLAALVFLILVKLKTGMIIGLTEALFKPLPKLRALAGKTIRSFAIGLAFMNDFRLFAICAFYSILVWLTMAAFYWVSLFAFSLPGGSNLGLLSGPWGALFLLGAIALGVMIPSSPGFVGAFEWACITALAALGADRPSAESYAIAIHAAQFIPITLAGIIYLYVQNFSFREIRSGGGKAKAELKGDS
ncbi:MAG: lysylphosphatidylglycerol synthase transmembrane domain-containing protein [Pseudomonadota bacterium]